ncbi:MAG: glycosyltransferase family 4 protein, partial [Burkholderiales bacterium]
DVVIATAFDTAFPVSGYPANKGRKFYLIQSYEDWNGPPGRVRESWSLPLHKIVISKWLLRIAEEMGESARTDYIPIGMDFSQFNITTPVERRAAPRVGMLAHPNEIKGLKDGLAALEIVRGQRPDLQAVLFGTSPRADEIPDWIEYEYRPAPEGLQSLYNSCQVYLHPSRREGWGLTAAEAMACGCALVSAENGGVDEFATDGESALLAPVKSPALLARQVTRLLEDHSLRHRLAQQGSQQVRRFTWDRAVDSLERLLLKER